MIRRQRTAYHRQYYWRNRDRILLRERKRKRVYDPERWRKYYLLNKAKLQARVRQYRLRNKAKYRKYHRHYTAVISDQYVRGLLAQNTSLRRNDFPPEIVELKRNHIRLLRAIRNTNT